LDGRAVTIPVVGGAWGEADGMTATPLGIRGTAETPEHLSMHSANFAQSPLVCLSQCCPGGQQSDGAAIEICGEETPALAAATGSMATERAVKATIMVRAMVMGELRRIIYRFCRGQVN
jgi:hypothetical protein